ALEGLRLFHVSGVLGFETAINPDPPSGPADDVFLGRSCVQCHSLPEGSNNRITFVDDADPVSGAAIQPLETAALRGLSQKEAELQLNATDPDDPLFLPRLRTGDFGTGHRGDRGRTRNRFVNGADLDGLSAGPLSAFLREFDHGVAPIVGFSI